MSALIGIEQRNAELYAAYKRALSKPGTNHIQAVYDAIHSPASRYWVSIRLVYREILARKRGYHTPFDPSQQRNKPHLCRTRMFDDLYNIYLELKNKRDFRDASTYFIVSFVVGRPAPRFYIDFRRAQDIIEQQRKQSRLKRLS